MGLGGWARDIGVSCLVFLTALPLAAFVLWFFGLHGLVAAIVFGLAIAAFSVVAELGLRDSSDES